MALLRTVEIGHPNDRPMARHHLSDHRGGTTVARRRSRLIVLHTQFQWVRPAMRTEVSSEQTIRERRSRARMAVTSVLKQLAHCTCVQRTLADLQRIKLLEQLVRRR